MRYLKNVFRQVLLYFARRQMDFWMGVVTRARPDWNPRAWSNRELRKVSSLFSGDVINVGAYRDEDKEGGYYRSYFDKATSYTLANYRGEDGATGVPGELLLDLSQPLDPSLGTYDVVFTHTVLEHVHPVTVAFDNICKLSRNHIISIVPFIQGYHGRAGSYEDYTRFSPTLLKVLFSERGFDVVYTSWNNEFPVMNVYILVIATKNSERIKGLLPVTEIPVVNKVGPGVLFSQFLWGDGPGRTWWRKAGEFLGIHLHVPQDAQSNTEAQAK